jgi:hypothetical protein
VSTAPAPLATHTEPDAQPAPVAPAPAALAGGDVPDWLWEHKLAQEVRAFFRTAVAFTLRPAQFIEEWRGGRADYLNPIAFMTVSVILLSAWGRLIQVPLELAGVTPPDKEAPSILGSILENLGPYLHYTCLAVGAHVVLVLAGSRVALRGSVAAALYAGGGPAAGLAALAKLAFLPYRLADMPVESMRLGLNPATVFIVCGVLGWSMVGWSLARGLAAVHRPRRRSAVLGVMVALLLSALFFGVVEAPGNYGFRVQFVPGLSSFSLALAF